MTKESKSINIFIFLFAYWATLWRYLNMKEYKTASWAMNISTLEMTAFDFVRYANASGYIHHVATVLSDY